MDSVGWDNGVTFPDPNGASMALLDTSLDNSVGSNWQESTTPYGNGDLGTPGIPNFSSDISLNSTELNFGMVGINESVVLNLTISNEGNGILRLDSLYTNSTLFTLSFTDSLIETPTELQVTFTPIEFGSVAGSLFIFSNDPNESLVEVTLSGFGTTMSLSDISLYFGAIVVGDTVIRQTTIYNLGMTDLEIEEINIDSDDSTSGFFTTDFSDGTIEAGDSISVEFQFTYDPGNMYIDDSVGAIATIVVSNIPDRTITLHAGSVLELENYFIPLQYILHQNYPNPFNPVTTLRYNLPEDALVNITIYDMMGRVVKTMVNSQQTAGYKSVRWNATNDKGSPVSAGLYLYTIEAGEFRQTKKMVLLK